MPNAPAAVTVISVTSNTAGLGARWHFSDTVVSCSASSKLKVNSDPGTTPTVVGGDVQCAYLVDGANTGDPWDTLTGAITITFAGGGTLGAGQTGSVL